MIALKACLAAWARLQPHQLLRLAVELLNLPTDGTRPRVSAVEAWVGSFVTNPDAANHGFGVAAILPTRNLDLAGVVFVGDRIVKEQVAVRRGDDRAFDLFPDEARRQLVVAQITVELVMAVLLTWSAKWVSV